MRRFLSAIGVALAVSLIYVAGGLEFLEHRLMDLRFRLSEGEASGDVLVVAIDPKSLRSLDVWPWDRGYHATVLENLIAAGAQQVAFDLDFSSRSQPDQDFDFEQALAAAGNRVTIPLILQWERTDAGPRLIATEPLPAYRRHVRTSTINIRPDSDGLVRRYWLEADVEGRTLPSFAAALTGQRSWGEPYFYIDYGIDIQTIPQVSYVDVLANQIDRQQIAGKIVIVGATAIELNDQVPTPLTSSAPGPLVQALAFESLRQGRALDRAGSTFTLTLAVLLTMLFVPVMVSMSWRQGLALVLATCGGVFLISLAVQDRAALMLDVSPWMLVTLGAYGVATARKIDQQGLTLLYQGSRLQHTEELMGHVVQNSFDAIVLVGDDGRIAMFNSAAVKMFGIDSDAALGRPIREFVAPDPSAEEDPEASVPLDLWQVEGQHEAVGRREDGTTLPLEIAVSSIPGKRPCHVGVLRDISERKAQQEALQHAATHDTLTGLPNRILLRERFEQALLEARENGWSVAFLLLDLNGFRDINDTLGHHMGDQLLQQIGQRLQGPLRASHTIARLGGDEFAVLAPNIDLPAAVKLAERLCQCLTEPFVLRRMTLHVSTSIGISMFPDHGLDSSELIQRADVAMYQAKGQRLGLAVYDADKDYNSVRHLALNGELREAIEKDQLTLFYQPKVSIQSGRINSVEALVRWQHPKHGMLPPDEFIGLAEHSGLIIPLTRWVVGKALTQCLAWRNDGIDLSMAVNLSARNLQEKGLPYDLEVLLQSCGLPPDRLILEITESVLMEDPEHSLQLLKRLGELGVRISIDDFGTGYSSLSYLKKLPAHELKIDRSFVMALDREEDDAVIVRSTIDMAHNLGLKVVAEGIETTQAWDRLRRFNCDYGQGYLFGRPVRASELDAQLKSSVGPAPLPATADAAADPAAELLVKS